MFPLHNLICEEEGGKWWLIEWSAKISWSILPQHSLQKRTCQKNELRYFRWNSGTISFPPNSWPAAGRRMWMTVNYNLHHAIAGFPDPRGFLREPQFPEGSPCFLRDIHRPKMDRLWIFYGSHGIFSTVFLHVFPQKEYYHTSCTTMIELLSTVLILAVFELDHFPVHGFLRLSRGQGGGWPPARLAAAQFAGFTADSKQWNLTRTTVTAGGFPAALHICNKK